MTKGEEKKKRYSWLGYYHYWVAALAELCLYSSHLAIRIILATQLHPLVSNIRSHV
jgi:hypothetical protein